MHKGTNYFWHFISPCMFFNRKFIHNFVITIGSYSCIHIHAGFQVLKCRWQSSFLLSVFPVRRIHKEWFDHSHPYGRKRLSMACNPMSESGHIESHIDCAIICHSGSLHSIKYLSFISHRHEYHILQYFLSCLAKPKPANQIYRNHIHVGFFLNCLCMVHNIYHNLMVLLWFDLGNP